MGNIYSELKDIRRNVRIICKFFFVRFGFVTLFFAMLWILRVYVILIKTVPFLVDDFTSNLKMDVIMWLSPFAS